MQLLGVLPRSATGLLDRLAGIHGLLQDLGVVDVGRRVGYRQRDASSVGKGSNFLALEMSEQPCR